MRQQPGEWAVCLPEQRINEHAAQGMGRLQGLGLLGLRRNTQCRTCSTLFLRRISCLCCVQAQMCQHANVATLCWSANAELCAPPPAFSLLEGQCVLTGVCVATPAEWRDCGSYTAKNCVGGHIPHGLVASNPLHTQATVHAGQH